ncbi:flagellar protein FliS, partial [Clostridioides difficile]|nr:flagellar protein FliS [Clostridioides difficile]
VVNKLINFTIELIDSFKINNKNKSVITMIKNDCLMLILFSVVYNAEFFSVGYIKEVEKFIPYTIDYSLEIEEKIKEKFKNIDVLNNENEYKEMIDIICAE